MLDCEFDSKTFVIKSFGRVCRASISSIARSGEFLVIWCSNCILVACSVICSRVLHHAIAGRPIASNLSTVNCNYPYVSVDLQIADAIQQGDVSVVQSLIEVNGGNVNEKDEVSNFEISLGILRLISIVDNTSLDELLFF